MSKKQQSRIVEVYQDGMFEIVKQPGTKKLVNTEAFQGKYKSLIEDFCQALISQYAKDEKVFPAGEPELVNLKLSQIRPEIEKLEKEFASKTKYGLDKIDRYSPDDIALFGYKKFEQLLNEKLKPAKPEIKVSERNKISVTAKPPQQIFKNFAILEAVLLETGLIDENKAVLLNKKESWKLTAFIEAVISLPALYIYKPSESAVLKTFNTYYNTQLPRGKKDPDGYDVFCSYIQTCLQRQLAKKAPK